MAGLVGTGRRAGATRAAVYGCHAALTVYGARRLEASGWRALGIGAVAAESPGFCALAWDLGVQWATYEARDRDGLTLAEMARADRAWFPRRTGPALEVLEHSRLDVYVVGDRRGPLLVRLRDGAQFAVAPRPDRILPLGATVAARVVEADDGPLVLGSVVIDDDAVAHVASGGSTLEAALRQFERTDQSSRGRDDEPHLIGYRRGDLVRLCRAVRALDHALADNVGPFRCPTSSGELAANRPFTGHPWTYTLEGDADAHVERVPPEVAHPVDAEIMRQIGAPPDAHVLQADGSVVALARACAEAAVATGRGGRRAA